MKNLLYKILQKPLWNEIQKLFFLEWLLINGLFACQQKKSEDILPPSVVILDPSLAVSRENLVEFKHHEVIETLLPVRDHLQGLISRGYAPSKILVILDVDGTLTNYPEPSAIQVIPMGPRKGVPELLRFLQQQSLPTLVSSAWNIQEEVLWRVQLIEKTVFPRGPAFLSEGCKKPIEYLNGGKPPVFLGSTHTVYRCGKITNIRNHAKNPPGYYFGKAFAILYGLPRDLQRQLKRVVFVDDNRQYHDFFKSDYEELRQHPSFQDLPKEVDFFQPQVLKEGKERGEP